MPLRKRGLQGIAKTEIRGGNDHPLAERIGRDDDAFLVPLSRIRPDSDQPRKSFDEASLTELADSIVEHGVIQPLTVFQEDDFFYIVTGERRFRAAQKAGLEAVPARVIRDKTRLKELQLVENLQREDLRLMEEARALQALQLLLQASVRKLEQATGKSKSYVSRRLALLKMPKDVQDMLEQAPELFSRAEGIAQIADETRRKARINALLRGASQEDVERTGSSPGRPVKPFVFKQRRSGAFDLTVKYRPGESDKAALVAQLKAALVELEK